MISVTENLSHPTNLVFWRHGRTAWNANGRLQGQSDIELDDVGRQQIAAAAQALAKEFLDAAIVSSDLKRARETADQLAALTGQTPIIDHQLRERSFGEWEGLGRPEIASRWPDLFEAWQRGSDAVAKPPGGESRSDVGKRVAAAVRRQVANLTGYRTLLVVSHGAAITAATTELLGEDAGTWHGVTGLDNANWSVLSKAKHGPNWRLVGHNLGVNPLNLNDIFGA